MASGSPSSRPAQVAHDADVVIGDAEIRPHAFRAVGEQGDGVVVDGQRRDAPAHLAGDPEGLTAGGQHLQIPASAEQFGDDRGRSVEHVLAVVDHQQDGPVADEPHDVVNGGQPRLIGQAQRQRDGHRDHVRMRDRRQVNAPGATGEFAGRRRGQLQRQPGLAHPTAPVRVSKRLSDKIFRSSVNSSRRPMKLVNCAGSEPVAASSVTRSGGNSTPTSR